MLVPEAFIIYLSHYNIFVTHVGEMLSALTIMLINFFVILLYPYTFFFFFFC